MTSIAISQSNYLPWRGYFHIIGSVDEFVLYDEVQYTKRDWRNRNVIKTPAGPAWLTVPVRVKGRYDQRIDETVVADHTWTRSHWSKIRQAYATAPYFDEYAPELADFFETVADDHLSTINRRLIEMVMGFLGLDAVLHWSTDYPVTSTGRNERLVSICRQAGADVYVTGPAAADYIDRALFVAARLDVRYIDYSVVGEYPQLHGEFVSQVSVIDTLFSVGADAADLIRGDGP